MFIDKRRAGCGAQNAESDWDEHKAGDTWGVAFSALVDDRVGDEEHVE